MGRLCRRCWRKFFNRREWRIFAASQSGRATVLVCKLEVFIFEELVHKDDEFAHAGGHGDEGFLSGGAPAGIKFLQDAVVAHGAQRGHVECAADGSATAVDASDSALFATVTVIGSHPRQCCGRLPGEFSEFRHFREHRRGHDRTNARDGPEPAGFVRELGVGGNQGGDGFIALFDLFFQRAAQLPGLAETERIVVMLGMVAFVGEPLDELATAQGQVGQLLLLRRSRWRRLGFPPAGGKATPA